MRETCRHRVQRGELQRRITRPRFNRCSALAGPESSWIAICHPPHRRPRQRLWLIVRFSTRTLKYVRWIPVPSAERERIEHIGIGSGIENGKLRTRGPLWAWIKVGCSERIGGGMMMNRLEIAA